MVPLNISDRRERLLVRAADLALAPARLRRRRLPSTPPRSILCLRLERIGDLVMTLPALAELRAVAPDAEIDLAVGSWNAEIARTIPGIRRVEELDAAWLARGAAGQGFTALLAEARRLRKQRYDAIINFEPDIRSNAMAAAAGGSMTAGFASGGGGSLLDLALTFDPSTHTSDNMVRLVRAASAGWSASPSTADDDRPRSEGSRLEIDAAARARAAERLKGLRAPVVAMHISGGRAIKQWPEERFAAVARWLIESRGASVVFTGSTQDGPQIARVRHMLPDGAVVDASGSSLLDAAALLERSDLIVTGDTGPMHVAHAVGTPVVAVFGPSDPRRYAPRGVHDRIVRIDLPCGPCNRIRQPPVRCANTTPDCLSGITVEAVTAAIDELLAGLGSPGSGISTVA